MIISILGEIVEHILNCTLYHNIEALSQYTVVGNSQFQNYIREDEDVERCIKLPVRSRQRCQRNTWNFMNVDDTSGVIALYSITPLFHVVRFAFL